MITDLSQPRLTHRPNLPPPLPPTTARTPVGLGSPHLTNPGCCTQSHGHHRAVTQPCVMKATSSAIHLAGRHGPWGFQPFCHSILVSYPLLMSLSGPRTVGSMSFLIPKLEAGYMYPCILALALSPISLMRTAAIATDTLCPVFLLITRLYSPMFMSPISSSAAELYFLS